MAEHRSWKRCCSAGKFFLVASGYLVGLAGLAILAASIVPLRSRHVPETSWAELRLVESADITGPVAIAAIFAMVVSIVIDKLGRRGADLRFYPVRRRVGTVLRNARSRVVLSAGGAILVVYPVTALVTPRFFGAIASGPFWPGDVVLVSLLWAWAIVWLAETVVPPVRTPAVVALVVGAASLFLGCCPSARPPLARQSPDGTALPVRSVSDLIHEIGCAIASRNVCHVPPWATETEETEHFIYHHAKDDSPIAASLDAQERHHAFFKKVFGTDLPQKIRYVKYPDRNSFADAWPDAGGIGGRGYIHSGFWFHPHEAVHSYLRSRNLFLHEGIAEAFGTQFYYCWGDIGDHPIEADEASLRDAMDRLLGRNETERRIAGNFVRWLYQRYGSKKLVATLREAYLEGSRTRDVLARIYGISFTDLASRWEQDQQWLREQPPPAGFFSYPPWDKEIGGSDCGKPPKN